MNNHHVFVIVSRVWYYTVAWGNGPERETERESSVVKPREELEERKENHERK